MVLFWEKWKGLNRLEGWLSSAPLQLQRAAQGSIMGKGPGEQLSEPV